MQKLKKFNFNTIFDNRRRRSKKKSFLVTSFFFVAYKYGTYYLRNQARELLLYIFFLFIYNVNKLRIENK